MCHKDREHSLDTLHKQRCFHVFTTPLSLLFPRLTAAELRITQLTPRSCCHQSTKRQKSWTQAGNGGYVCY